MDYRSAVCAGDMPFNAAGRHPSEQAPVARWECRWCCEAVQIGAGTAQGACTAPVLKAAGPRLGIRRLVDSVHLSLLSCSD